MKRNDGFTLIELLVVIGILGILMAMMIPGAGMIMKKSKTSTARTGAVVVQTALQRYRTEYNVWPDFAKGSSKTHYTDDEFMATMAPLPTEKRPPAENLKRIVFIEVSKGATTEISSGKFEYRDPWGKPYQYLVNETPMDTMKLGSFKKDYSGPDEIRAKALVWSAGPDGDYETWGDNVASWDY
jgi:prepilin-type N-terminal cleavage/methylation domain-containing protein